MGERDRRGVLKSAVWGVLGAAALVIGGCGKADTPVPTPKSGTGGSARPAAHVIKIGHYGSLTGSKATFGKSTDNAIRLAVNQVNASGGVSIGGVKHQVELVSEDTEGKMDKAGTVVTKLITKDKVSAIIGEVASSITMAGAPVAQQYGVPMITPSSTNPDVTKIGDFISRVCYIDPFQGQAAAKFAVNDLKVKTAAVLFDQSAAYSVGLKDEFNKAFIALGGKITTEQAYTEGAADFNAQLTKMREGNPEIIFIPGYYSDIANIAIQARKLGMKQPLLGGDGWDSEELGANAKEAIEGSFYTNHYAPDQKSETVEKFLKDYGAAFGGAVPDGLAALGYDAARVLFAAMEKAGSTEGAKLRDAINATKDFPGVTGVITLNAERDAVKSIVVVERKKGAWVFRARIDP
jgi:branched-chain amino acid transport system substrate-binding protein